MIHTKKILFRVESSSVTPMILIFVHSTSPARWVASTSFRVLRIVLIEDTIVTCDDIVIMIHGPFRRLLFQVKLSPLSPMILMHLFCWIGDKEKPQNVRD